MTQRPLKDKLHVLSNPPPPPPQKETEGKPKDPFTMLTCVELALFGALLMFLYWALQQ